MDLRLIALDLDGTTLNSQGKVSLIQKKILEKALSKGILVVIASGRALSAIPEDILNIRGLKYIILPTDPVFLNCRTAAEFMPMI